MKNALDIFLDIMEANRKGFDKGIYSVCSAHPDVLEVCFKQAKRDESVLLIESTSNQVNQYGGYTGMKPPDFVRYINRIAEETGFPKEKILLGGDHLGPNPWKKLNSEQAMEEAKMLVAEYVKAGYRKIHLDASMLCADDTGERKNHLPDEIVAQRASILCHVAEETWKRYCHDSPPPVYVIGTEVPVPGGAQEEEDEVIPTTPEDAEKSITVTRKQFAKVGLAGTWERVTGVVVQPGVEFGDDRVSHYQPEKAEALSEKIMELDHLVFEAHSTDYQTKKHLKALVKGHFCILKVGPWLTFAYREALFALEAMEVELLGKNNKDLSKLGETLERAMLKVPKYWNPYYKGKEQEQAFKRKYSFSDRVRYYWSVQEVGAAKDKLLKNLQSNEIPLSVLSQFMPTQFYQVCRGRLSLTPKDLVNSHIQTVAGIYSHACGLSQNDK